jgi:twitching motility protein PilT
VAPVATGPAPVGEGLLGYAPGVDMLELLKRARGLGASDLHVHGGAPLKVRLHGELTDASEILDRDTAAALIQGILTEPQRATLEERLQLDFSYSLPGIARFRANAYHQHRGLDAVFRVIPPTPPSLEELGLPESLAHFAEYHQGLVLFTGPGGCGKSSTMAAFVRMINAARKDHILTIEEPVEYIFEPDQCVVNQREVGPHTESFARALRAALREDPDIIVIGEMRDLETIELALTAAETGHLVLGTLHTGSTIATINRVVGVFPPDAQAQIRTMVSESLRAIISQRLLPLADGTGQVPALEVLVNNRAIGNLIRENRTFQIRSILQTGARLGMCLLDKSLQDLVEQGLITQETARGQASDPKKFV